MKGRLAEKTTSGYPYGGGPERAFERIDVVAFAKETAWGSAAIHFWVRLTDGVEVMVKACDQAKGDERWLRRIAKAVYVGRATRQEGWRFAWVDVSAAQRAGSA